MHRSWSVLIGRLAPAAILPFALLVLLVLLVPHDVGAQERVISDPGPNIETVGMGERRIPPDRASVLLLVESKAPVAAAAAAANARTVQAVRDTLRRFGVDSAVTTAGYNVGPNYEPPRPMDREGPRQVGYVARTVLRVPLGRIDLVGRTIDAGLAGGATGVQGVVFEASTTPAARRDALALAAAEARQDAERLARALGGTLGPLLSTSTAGGGMDPRMVAQRRIPVTAMSYSTQIAPDEIVVTAVVTTRWRFLPNQ
jgi:uncharacterized protein